VCWNWSGRGSAGRHLVNNVAFAFLMFTRSFHLVKYLCSVVMAWLSRRAMMSFRQDCVRMAVSSAYSANWVLGDGACRKYKWRRGLLIGLLLEVGRREYFWVGISHHSTNRFFNASSLRVKSPRCYTIPCMLWNLPDDGQNGLHMLQMTNEYIVFHELCLVWK
jgi:hypothetical protein